MNPVPVQIGKYKLHPAAQLFPELDIGAYGHLKTSIEHIGQQNPIYVQGDVLLDGRHRLRVCLELGITSDVVEYTGPLSPADLIEAMNMRRRDLTADQRAQIQADILTIQHAEQMKAAQLAGTKTGGRGHKKNSIPVSVSSLAPTPSMAKAARTTVGQIAAKAKVSRHKAAQA